MYRKEVFFIIKQKLQELKVKIKNKKNADFLNQKVFTKNLGDVYESILRIHN